METTSAQPQPLTPVTVSMCCPVNQPLPLPQSLSVSCTQCEAINCTKVYMYYIELRVTVTADYRRAGGEGELGPNQFTAGSLLSLTCSVQGATGPVSYIWSVRDNPGTPDCTGSNCDIDTLSTDPTLTVGNPHLLSYYAGVYTCTVRETGRSDSTNSEDFTVTVVGE